MSEGREFMGLGEKRRRDQVKKKLIGRQQYEQYGDYQMKTGVWGDRRGYWGDKW